MMPRPPRFPLCCFAFSVALVAGSSACSTLQSTRLTQSLDIGSDLFKAATLTDQEVVDVSRQYVEWLDANNPVATDADEYGRRLQRLTAGLEREDGLRLNFKAYLVLDVNAFATADGSVRVFAGLMDIMDDGELRSVIGHEIGHVKHEHSKDSMRTAYLASAGRKAVAAKSGGVGDLSNAELGELGEAFGNAQFSQGQEYAADDYGFEFLKRHKHDTMKMASAFRKLAKLSGDGGGLMSSHPGALERAQRVEIKAGKRR